MPHAKHGKILTISDVAVCDLSHGPNKTIVNREFLVLTARSLSHDEGTLYPFPLHHLSRPNLGDVLGPTFYITTIVSDISTGDHKWICGSHTSSAVRCESWESGARSPIDFAKEYK